jgi:hypothetical protein
MISFICQSIHSDQWINGTIEKALALDTEGKARKRDRENTLSETPSRCEHESKLLSRATNFISPKHPVGKTRLAMANMELNVRSDHGSKSY